jgi:hypothetical protein
LLSPEWRRVPTALEPAARMPIDTWKIAGLAQEFPSAPFFAITPLRATDAPAVARCSMLEFCDVIADGMDDQVRARHRRPADFFSALLRGARGTSASASLETEMQLKTWRAIVVAAVVLCARVS